MRRASDALYAPAMTADSSKPLAGRIVLVTGASRGIGQACALAMAKAGAHIIAAARTQGGLEELDDAIFAATGEHATLTPFDLVDGGAIDRLGGAVFERFKRLDVLVHAAAMPGQLTPVSHMEPREWAKVVAINLTASYRLIRSFEPLLKASDAGRAIFFTSGVVPRPRAFFGAYAATKAGVESLVRCWADEIENTPVRSAIVNPGPMRTRMRAEAFPGEDPMTLPPPEEITPLIVDLARADRQPSPTPTIEFSEWKAAQVG